MKVFSLAVAALVVSGCSVQSVNESPEEVGANSSALLFAPNYKFGAWHVGDGDVALASAATHFCVLSKVSGLFRNPLDNIDVLIVNGQWVIRGSAYSGSMYGEATCVDYTAFERVTGGYTTAWTNFSSDNTMGPPNPGVAPKGMMTWLSYMGGKFAKTGDKVQVYENGVNWFDYAFAQPGDYTRSRSISNNMFNSGGYPMLMNYASQTRQQSPSDGAVNNSFIDLGPTIDRFCYLTLLSGRFDGGGEWVELKQSAGRWLFRADSGGQANDVLGEARCAYYKLTVEVTP